MKLAFKLTGVFLIFTLLTTVLLYLIGLQNQHNNFKQIALEHIKHVKVTFDNLEERDTHILSSALEVVVQDPRLKEVYLHKNREDLCNYVQPLFQNLKHRHGITHFYFILPDGHVFLRVHNKEIYGDLVERKSFQKARSTKGPAWEMELGKTAFALRSVMPYYKAGTLIGYVELGEQIDQFLNILRAETYSEFGIIADKIYLDRNDWESMRRVAGLRDNWDDLERHLVISSTSEGETTAKCFTENNLELTEKGEKIHQKIQDGNRTFMCGGFALNNAGGQHMGAILTLIDITDHAAAAQKANKNILRIAITLFVITCMVGILISRALTKPILKLTQVAKEVGRGNLAETVSVTSSDEIGQLAETFNTMIEMRKQTEEALQKSEEKYRSLVESTDDSIYLVDRNYRYLYMNTTHIRKLGLSGNEYLGREYSEYHSTGETGDFMAEVTKVFETGKSFRHEHLNSRDNRYYLRTLSPVKDEEGRTTAITVVSKDITEQKLAEMTLREEGARLVSAVAATTEAVISTDARGVIQYVNPAFEEMTGYASEEAVGQNLHILDSGKHDEAFYRDLREMLKGEGIWTARLVNKKKDGALYEELCTCSPIKSQSGEIISYVFVKRDITEKIRLESIAQAVDTMKNIGYIFSGVNHEIGNPINTINLTLNLLMEKLGELDRPAIEKYISRCLKEIEKVIYLLRSLKSFNMFENLRLGNVPMQDFMDKFLALIKKDFAKKGIGITAHVESDADLCSADPRALQQMLLNLLTNAADALKGRENPHVAISVSRAAGMIRVGVEDNGCGIPESALKDLFKPFYTTKKYGTGLGLVIAKKMITKMNGTIEIMSRKDEGTRVDLYIPLGNRADS